MRAINIDKDILFDLYITKNGTRKEVAEYFGCAEVTIKKGIKKYNLPKKSNEAHQKNVEKVILEKYGYKNSFQVPEFKKKIQDTGIENYGSVENRYIIAVENQVNTCRKLYNADSYFQTEEFKERSKQTKLEKYNDPTYTNKEKASETCLKKYGLRNPGVLSKNRKYVYYDGVSFDSSGELALYIYAKDHDEEIDREPIIIPYNYNGKEHYYKPDFLYKDKLIEVKADNALDENGNLIAVRGDTDQNLLLAKSNAMREHNIIIGTFKEIKPFIDYVNKTYSNDYLKSFAYKRRNT